MYCRCCATIYDAMYCRCCATIYEARYCMRCATIYDAHVDLREHDEKQRKYIRRDDWLWLGLTMSQNCGHQRGLFFIPRVICGEPWWWWCRSGDNSRLVYQRFLAVLPAQTSEESTRNGRSGDFAYQYLKYLKESLTRRKILRHGTSGFTSHPKECMLRIFIALKNPSPRPGLNSRPLGPVASH
jgi:hypothetical protein